MHQKIESGVEVEREQPAFMSDRDDSVLIKFKLISVRILAKTYGNFKKVVLV